jgi:predicted DNA-binding protein with PD1-like motif
MKPGVIYVLFILLLCIEAFAQNKSEETRYIKTPTGYLMVLRQGDEVFEQLEKMAWQEHIPSASFTGMGFAEVTLGFFNVKTKKYKSKRFKAAELAAMQGSLAWQEGKPSIHMHGVIADKKFNTRGGHILSAKVGTGTLEIAVVLNDKRLEREKDKSLGANVLCLDQCN